VEPASPERPRANRHTLAAQSAAALDTNVETIKIDGTAKDPG
jgi:hypothetical protein